MTQHTPGPWVVVHQFNVAAGRRMIASTATISGNIQTGDALVAENEANACLIAAAPDLLAVARQVVENSAATCDRMWVSDAELADMARLAIAKAEGRS